MLDQLMQKSPNKMKMEYEVQPELIFNQNVR